MTLKIQELREAIRRKYYRFKYGEIESADQLKKHFKPLINELRKTGPNVDIKVEPKEEPKEEEEVTYVDNGEEELHPVTSTPLRTSRIFKREETPSMSSSSSTPVPQSATSFVNTKYKNNLTNEYMGKMYGYEKRSIDNVTGPRIEGEALLIGTKLLTFGDDGSIIVGGVRFPASRGLYELIFKTAPSKEVYNSHDIEKYMEILELTSAHRRGYSKSEPICRHTTAKYRNVIKDLYPKSTGRGWKSAQERDLVRWDDPNELVIRLKHLVVSTETGNRGHVNEMINIIEELREAGYITGGGNHRLASVLQ